MLEALPVPIGGAFPNNTADMIHGREKTRAELQAELAVAQAEAAQYGAMAVQCQAMIEDTMQALELKEHELANAVGREEHLGALAAAERRVREEERDRFDGEREALNQLRQQQQNEFNAQITEFAEQMQVQEQMIELLQAQAEAGPSQAVAAPSAVQGGDEGASVTPHSFF